MGASQTLSLHMSRSSTSTSRLAPAVGCLGHLREQTKDPASHITKTTPDQLQDALGTAARDFRTYTRHYPEGALDPSPAHQETDSSSRKA